MPTNSPLRCFAASLSRRAWLAGGLAALAVPTSCFARVRAEQPVPIGFSLYGMRKLETLAALSLCRQIGYETVELPLMADWPLDAARVSNEHLGRVRACLALHELRVAGFMEHLVLTGDDAQHQRTLDRWRVSLRVAQALAPEQRPVVETILGGKPADWPAVRDQFRARLADWAKLAAETGATIAIKAHVSGAAHLPEHIVWLLEHTEPRGPHLRAAYDYSHFQLQGQTLRGSLDQLLPYTAFIHVKDTQGVREKFQFLLPGQGTPNIYPELFELLRRSSYRGGVVVEVSGQLHQKPDYDPAAAAQLAWNALQQARESAP